jgi:hypothetical protein
MLRIIALKGLEKLRYWGGMKNKNGYSMRNCVHKKSQEDFTHHRFFVFPSLLFYVSLFHAQLNLECA